MMNCFLDSATICAGLGILAADQRAKWFHQICRERNSFHLQTSKIFLEIKGILEKKFATERTFHWNLLIAESALMGIKEWKWNFQLFLIECFAPSKTCGEGVLRSLSLWERFECRCEFLTKPNHNAEAVGFVQTQDSSTNHRRIIRSACSDKKSFY